VLETQQVPAGANATNMTNALAQRHFRVPINAQLGRPGAGSPQYLIAFYYSNERRGGEVVTGGTVAYWDGANVVPVAEVNSADGAVRGSPLPEGGSVSVPPFRPLTSSHLALARALHGRAPVAAADDGRVQARLLDAAAGSTVVAINRNPSAIDTAIHARGVRLPSRGTLTLPAATGLLLPLGWDLGGGVRIVAATAQLLDSKVGRGSASLDMLAPAGGELIVALPGRLTSVRGATPAGGGRLLLPAGEPHVELSWS
jgi:hypothetical protein